MPDRYLLNVNEAGDDVVHRNPREECNTDDADHLLNIDADTAIAIVMKGDAVRCAHCNAEEPA